MSVPTSLRPATPGDRDVLRRIYAESRDDVASLVDWTEEQKDAFLTMQFEAQHRDYHERFAGARFDLIVSGDEVVGRLYVDPREDEIRILDIAVLRAWRRRGIGSHWMRRLLDEAYHERFSPIHSPSGTTPFATRPSRRGHRDDAPDRRRASPRRDPLRRGPRISRATR